MGVCCLSAIGFMSVIIVCLCGVRDEFEFKHDNAFRFLVDHPAIGPTEPEGLFHFLLMWTLCFCPFRPDLRSSHLDNRFRLRCQPYFGYIFVRESPLMLLTQRERGEVFNQKGLQWLLELQVYTRASPRCFVGDLWCLGRVSEVPNPSLCITYTGHISHPIDCPISGGVTRTEMFPSLSEEDTDVPSTGSACRQSPSLPVLTFPCQEVVCPRSGYRGSVRMFPHRSCHHSVP
jgi:hypothetical protein